MTSFWLRKMFEAVEYLIFLMEKAFLGLLCEDHFAADISGIESNIVGQKLEKQQENI